MGMGAADSLNVMSVYDSLKERYEYNEETKQWGDPQGLSLFLTKIDSESENKDKKNFLNKMVIESTGDDISEKKIKQFAKGGVIEELKSREGDLIQEIYAKRKELNFKDYQEFKSLIEDEFDQNKLGYAIAFTEKQKHIPDLYGTTTASVQGDDYSYSWGQKYYQQKLFEDFNNSEEFQTAIDDLSAVIDKYSSYADKALNYGPIDAFNVRSEMKSYLYGRFNAPKDWNQHGYEWDDWVNSSSKGLSEDSRSTLYDRYKDHPRWETIIKPAIEKAFNVGADLSNKFKDKFSKWVGLSGRYLDDSGESKDQVTEHERSLVDTSDFDPTTYRGKGTLDMRARDMGVVYKGKAKEYEDLLESLNLIQEDVRFIGGDTKSLE